MTEDKLTKLHKNLQSIKDKYEELSKSGIDKEILIIYLHHKSHMSIKKVTKLLSNIDEFYNQLVSDAVAEKL